MADVSLDMQQQLLATIEKINITMGQTNDLLNTGKKINDSMVKTQDKMVDNYDDIVKHQKEYNKHLGAGSSLLKGMEAIASRLKNLFLNLFGLTAIASFVKNILEMNQSLRETAFRMGLGAKGLGQLQSAVQGVVSVTGMAAREAGDLVMSLTQITGKNKDIGALAVTAGQLVKVTGLSAEAAAQLTGNLSRMGKLGASSITSIATTMATVQRAVGLTTGEMDELSRTTTRSAMLLKQMGKSAGDIEKFSKGTALLAGAFRSVGVEAGEALKIVEELLDPTKVEDNAFLYSKLGVSLSDAFSGNVDPGMLAGKFKELGAQLKGMNPAAAGAMAKELGISLSTLRQFDDIDMDKFGTAMKEAGGDYQKALASMQKEQTGPLESLKQLVNKFSVPLMKIINSLERILGPIINSLANFLEKGLSKVNPMIDRITSFVEKGLQPMMKLLANPATWIIVGLAILGIFVMLKMKAKLFAKDLGESISEGVRGGLAMGHEKGNRIAEEKNKKVGRAMSEDRMKRVMETYEFQDKQEEANFTRAQERTAKHFKGIMGWSARMQEGAAFGVKAQSSLIGITDSYNIKARERYDIQLQENKQLLEERRNRTYTIQAEQEILGKREQELLSLEKMSPAQAIELKKIQEKQVLLAESADMVRKDLINIEASGQRASDALLQTLSPDVLAKMRDELTVAKETGEARLKEINDRSEQIKLEEQMRKNAVDMLNVENDKLNTMRLEGTATYEDLARQKEISAALQEQKGLEGKLAAEAEILTRERKQQEDILRDQQKTMEKIEKTKPLGDPKALKGFQNFFTQLKNAGKAFGSNIEGALTAGVQKFGKNLKEAADNFKKGIAAAPGYLKALGGGGALGMLKGAGSFLAGKRITGTDESGKPIIEKKAKSGKSSTGALLGGIGMLVGFLMRLEPIQKMITSLMEQIKPIVNDLGATLAPMLEDLRPTFTIVGNALKQLMPIIGDLFKKVIGAIMPILMMLLPPLLDLVKALLPAIMPIIDLLINVLMKAIPIILKILGGVLFILGNILKAIGSLVLFFDKKNKIGLAIKEMGESLVEQGQDLWKGTKRNDDALLEATQNQTEAIESFTDNPAVYQATGMQGKEFVKTQDATLATEQKTSANVEAQTKIQTEMAKTNAKTEEAVTTNAAISNEMLTVLKGIKDLLSNQGGSGAEVNYIGGGASKA